MNRPGDSPCYRSVPPGPPAFLPGSPGAAAVIAVADWAGQGCLACNGLAAASCLYRSTLELLSGPEADPDAHSLRRPLSLVVSQQKTRDGQAECARFARALTDGDYPAALDACHRLIEREQGREDKPWGHRPRPR